MKQTFKFLTLFLLVLLGTTQPAWAYNSVYLIGDPIGGWSKDASYNITNGGDEGSLNIYFEKNNFFAVYIDYYNEQAGPSNDQAEMGINTGNQKFFIWGDGQNNHSAKYTGNSGVVQVHAKQKDNGDDQPWIWLTRPTVKFKYGWNGAQDWTEKDATDNGDGTYTLDENYGGTNAFNAGVSAEKYSTTYTTVQGSPQNGDKCQFKWNSKNYRPASNEGSWCGSFTITRYMKITYDANGATSGSAPSATEALYNTSATVASKGTLAKTGYIFDGWKDGSGNTYTEGQVISNLTSDMTLTAQWKKQTYLVIFGVYTDGHGTLTAKAGETTITSPANVDASAKVVFTANADDGYHVDAWYTNSGCTEGKHNAGASSYTINSIAAAENVYVKFLPNTYKVHFDGKGNTSGTMADQSFTYNEAAKALTTNTFAKTGYTYKGWDDQSAGTTVKYENGASVQNLTTTNGGTFNLYAVWQENMNNNIMVQSNNTDKGTVNVSSVSFGYTTGATIVATHAPGYYLADWTLPANAKIASTNSTATTTTIVVKASGDAAVSGIITANFAERWVLRGSTKASDSELGGMPGWSNETAMTVDANGVASVNVTLIPNTDFKFKIKDLKTGGDKGQQNEATLPPMDQQDSKWTLNGDKDVYLATVGYGQYTIYVKVDSDNPQVYYSAPTSHLINMGTKFTTEGCATSLDGGTLTAKTTENETDFDISNGKYVREGGSVTFTAAAKTGYRFAGFYSDATCETKIQDASPYIASNITAATTVYAKFEEILKEVSVIQYDGTSEIKKVGVASHPQITANAVENMQFTGWQTNHVIVENASNKTTTLTGYSDGYNVYSVTATFGPLSEIYFDLSAASTWNPSCMYVYFYYSTYWGDDDGTGTKTGGAYSGTHLEMQKVDPNNNKLWVLYFDPSTIGTGLQYITHIAFADQNKPDNDWNGEYFSACNVSYFDYNQCMNMCVLLNDYQKHPKNHSNACYRNEGFWKTNNMSSSKLYLKLYGGGVGTISETEFNHAEGDGWYSCSVHLAPQSGLENFDYYFIIGSCDGNNWTSDGWNIYASTAEGGKVYPFYKKEEVYGKKVTIHATAVGSYKFFVKHNNNNELSIKVEYPVYVGDYHVISIIDGDAHDNGYLYKSSTTEDEMASFYVKNGATIQLQRCSTFVGTDAVWEDVGEPITMNGLPEAGAYYNFKITHNEGNASIAKDGVYVGNFYIRTDVAAGGWTDYKTNPDNILTEYSYGSDESQPFKFTHAYVNHVNANGNVQFVIANDYSKCITDTLTTDTYVTDKDGKLPNNKDANVRFMWNKTNNTIARAYIGGSARTQDRYLILLGNTKTVETGTKHLMVDTEGHDFPEGGTGRDGLHADEAIFTDLGNWVYQVDVKAFPGAAVKLTADFAGKTQYFVGAAEGDNQWRKIMDGTDISKSYKMRVVFDFKNNQLVAGWLPDNETITGEISLGGDMLLVRNGQETATQIKFGEASSSKVSKIQQIYGVLELNKERMTNLKDQTTQERIPLTNSSYDRCLYWISFPFRVQISKVFGGVGDYGVKWIMQKYNGHRRAEVGWFKDQTTFWEYMGEDEYLEPYVGYVLVLDANYFDEPSDEVWQNVEENVAFYFPSEDKEIDIISSASKKVTVPEHPCGINVWFGEKTKEHPEGSLNHTNTDSHWNVIGIPAFEDLTESLEGTGKIGLNALYAWDPSTNGYNVQATSGTSYVFEAMKAYMVQFAGDIDWKNASVINKNVASAPKYAYADNKNYTVDLFFSNGVNDDHTYVKLVDEANTDFVLNEDMMKIDNAGFPNIYSFAGNYNVAYNETKMDNQSVMLGVSAPKEGTYTFSMPKEFSGTAKLVDLVEGITTDLNVSNYSVDLNKGTYNNRFQLLLEVEAKAPTSILADGQKGREADGKTQKLLRNGNIYLINAGRVYNATGAELR